MNRRLRLNLTRWVLLESIFLSFSSFLFYLALRDFDFGALFGAAVNVFVFSFFFLYGRPPTMTVQKNDISFSLYGFKTEIPFEAMQVTITDTSRPLGRGVDRITAYSRIVPLPWIYWLVLAGALTIFGVITYKEGFSDKVLLGSLIFLVGGFLFVFVLQVLMKKFLSIRVTDAELRIFVNSNYLDTLDKFPYRYYKSRFLHYRLGMVSELNRRDLQYLIDVFRDKLREERIVIDDAALRKLSLA